MSIPNLDDPRLAPYRDLNQQNLTRHSGRFIAEGDKLVERLLASGWPVESLLVDERFLPRFSVMTHPETPIYAAPQALLEKIIGFNFHRGALACGRRRSSRPLAGLAAEFPPRALVVVCPDVQDPANLGSIIRTSAAFGATAVLLGNQCADPFSRRVLRVSMGAAFQLPVLESRDLAADLRLLQRDHDFTAVATVLDESAQPLAAISRPARTALLLGGEGHGLAAVWQSLARQRVTIPMQLGIDSLNVANAAAIFLYHFSQPDSVASREATP